MSDITTTQIFAAGEKNITATKMNNIIGGAVIQPDFFANKAVASSVNPTDNLLILSGGAYAQAPFSTVVNAVGASMTPQITAVRLRSFNALQNSTFEVDQRTANAGVTNPATGTFICDRWVKSGSGTYAVNCRSVPQTIASGNVLLPGTSFRISQNYFQVNLTTAQATLGASDQLSISQTIEGPRLRELISDVHSVSLIVQSTVAPLKFSVAIRDPGGTRSLVKLCTITTANVWQLIQLPNLPVFDSGGGFSLSPGAAGYSWLICLAGGSNFIAPAADIWQTGNYIAAPGMDSFVSKSTGSLFWAGFVQHEPGSQCTTPIDYPFQQNLDDCTRYYQKSYDYATAAGTVTTNGVRSMVAPTPQAFAWGPLSYVKPLAKVPTVTFYNHATGAANSVRDANNIDHASAATFYPGQTGIGGIQFTTATTAAMQVYLQYTADAGW